MKKDIKHIDLNSISNPDFLKDMSYEELDVLSEDIRSHLIYVTSQNGGHLSSNLGVVEASISLCKNFDFTKDKIIFDVGHQCYTYKLLTGRNLSTLRKKDGISGFQKISESNYDHYEAGHSSTSISAALGMATARDLNKENYNIISFIGDSSVVNGLSMEALNNIGQDNHKIILVLNDNDMSISLPTGGLSKFFRKLSTSKFYNRSKRVYKRFLFITSCGRKIYNFSKEFKNRIKRKLLAVSLYDYFGLSIIGPIDGHNIKKLDKAFARAKKNDKSTLIMIKTIKGKGYSYAENDKEGKWHGVSSFNIETGKMDKPFKLSWSAYFASLVDEKMANDSSSVVITPGTGYGSALTPLFAKYKDRMIDVGIAEEHALVLASGLSISGKHPIISIYSTFLQRGYDELSHDLARMNLNATLLLDRSGLVGSDGETHQGIYDVAYLKSIPNVTISMPSNSSNAKTLFEQSFENHGPFAIRYPREETKVSDSKSFKYGEWIKEIEGNNVAIISLGPIVDELKEIIINNNYKVTLFNAIYQKPMDINALNGLLNYKKIIIHDCYGTETGFANDVCTYFAKNSYKGEIIVKAIGDEFVKQASITEQRKLYKVSVEDIIDLVK